MQTEEETRGIGQGLHYGCIAPMQVDQLFITSDAVGTFLSQFLKITKNHHSHILKHWHTHDYETLQKKSFDALKPGVYSSAFNWQE